MVDVPLSTYPNSWESFGGGIINGGTYIAKTATQAVKLSVSEGTLGGVSYSLTAGKALSFGDGAKVLSTGIQSKEELAALAVRFMREYPQAEWQGGRDGKLVDGEGSPIYRFR